MSPSLSRSARIPLDRQGVVERDEKDVEVAYPSVVSIQSSHCSHDKEEFSAMCINPWRFMRPPFFSIGLLGVLSLGISRLYAQDHQPDPQRGKVVYERHCQSCHGPTGQGDGPDVGSLELYPTNFQKYWSFLKSDKDWLRAIEQGVGHSSMRSWRGQLTDEEMQDVVSYIRLLLQKTQ